MRHKTFGFTKERASRISRRTQQIYMEKYPDIEKVSFALLYDFNKTKEDYKIKLIESLDQYGKKSVKFECKEEAFSFFILCMLSETKLSEENQNLEYEQVMNKINVWQKQCTDKLIDFEKN